MNKEELFKLLEKNLKDFENLKIESVKPNGEHLVIDNFGFEYGFFYSIEYDIRKLDDFTKEDEDKLSKLEMELDRIKQMPYVLDELKKDEEGYWEVITKRIKC